MKNTNEEARNFIADLYNDHYQNMMKMVSRDALCASMAEDIVQDTFTEAMDNAEKLLTHENPGGWLMETAKRKMLSARRKLLKHNAREGVELEYDIARMEADYGLVEMSFLMDQVLTLHEKALFYMYYYGGYSARELAEMENISEGTFKVKMFRLRKKLQKDLQIRSAKKADRRNS